MPRLIHLSRRVLDLFNAAGPKIAQQAKLAASRRAKRSASRASMLAAILAGLLYAGPGLAQTSAEPTSDPLRGERRLLPMDDVLVYQWPENETPAVQVLSTFENAISSDYTLKIPAFQDSFGISAGKMFAAPQETIAVAQSGQMNLFLFTTQPWSGSMPHRVAEAISTQSGSPSAQNDTLVRPLMAMDDFTGDGYAEIVIGTVDHGLQVASAVDVTDPSKGVTWADFYANGNPVAGSALATGDFDGDGLAEVALAYPVDASFRVAATQFRVEIYKVDPNGLSLNFAHAVTVDGSSFGQGSFPIRKVSITAGDFDSDVSDLGLPDEEIVVTASGVEASDTHFAIQTFDVSSTYSRWPLMERSIPSQNSAERAPTPAIAVS